MQNQICSKFLWTLHCGEWYNAVLQSCAGILDMEEKVWQIYLAKTMNIYPYTHITSKIFFCTPTFPAGLQFSIRFIELTDVDVYVPLKLVHLHKSVPVQQPWWFFICLRAWSICLGLFSRWTNLPRVYNSSCPLNTSLWISLINSQQPDNSVNYFYT